MKILLLATILLLIQAQGFSQTIMYISSKKADCTGTGPGKCLQIKYSPDDKWQLFYGSIEGFEYMEGFEYEIIVEKEEIKNPPADGSSIKYKMKELKKRNIPVVNLFIANRFTECEDKVIYKCLLINEKGENEWKPLNTTIEGFTYIEGNEYELEAEKIHMTIPEEQGYLYNYRLKKIISEKPTMILSVTDKEFLDKGNFKLRRMRKNNSLVKSEDSKLSINFDLQSSKVYGNDGCNNFSGKAEINNRQIKLGPFMMTKKACPDMERVNLFYSLISETEDYKIKGKYLKLYNGNELLIELIKNTD